MPDHFDHGMQEHRRRVKRRRKAQADAIERHGRDRLRGLRRVARPPVARSSPRRFALGFALGFVLVLALFVVLVERAS